MEIDDKEVCGVISVRRDHFLLVHDYFAMVLNTALNIMEESMKMGSPLSREECAGRILMVTMLQMEEFSKSNPDAIEEMIVAAQMLEDKTSQRSGLGCDAMYG